MLNLDKFNNKISIYLARERMFYLYIYMYVEIIFSSKQKPIKQVKRHQRNYQSKILIPLIKNFGPHLLNKSAWNCLHHRR